MTQGQQQTRKPLQIQFLPPLSYHGWHCQSREFTKTKEQAWAGGACTMQRHTNQISACQYLYLCASYEPFLENKLALFSSTIRQREVPGAPLYQGDKPASIRHEAKPAGLGSLDITFLYFPKDCAISPWGSWRRRHYLRRQWLKSWTPSSLQQRKGLLQKIPMKYEFICFLYIAWSISWS